MIRLTSHRERRLWAGALVVLLAILVSALFAGTLVDTIGSETLLAVGFATGLVLSIAAVLGTAVGRSRSSVLWAGVGVVAVMAMIPVRAGVGALERTHLFEFGLLAVLLHEALVERRGNGADVRLPGITAVGITAGLGWVDEAVQSLVPGRVYDLRDVAVNALAALVAVTAVVALRKVRDPRP